jgi:hypothetical protein
MSPDKDEIAKWISDFKTPDEITVLNFDYAMIVRPERVWQANHVHDLDGTCRKRRAGPPCEPA